MPILLVSKSVVDVHFNFSTLNNTIVPDLLFNATIGNLSIDTRAAKIDQQAGLLVFSMDSSLMGNLIYELYTIKFSMLAQNETEEHSLDMTIIYEQAIEDIMVNVIRYISISDKSIRHWILIFGCSQSYNAPSSADKMYTAR